MEIKKLDPAQWRGYGFTARYQTGGCWDIVPVEEGFRIEYHSFGKVEERSFNDTLFGEWLEAPVVYGAFQDGELLALRRALRSRGTTDGASAICAFFRRSTGAAAWPPL